jgi:hypothetical protein
VTGRPNGSHPRDGITVHFSNSLSSCFAPPSASSPVADTRIRDFSLPQTPVKTLVSDSPDYFTFSGRPRTADALTLVAGLYGIPAGLSAAADAPPCRGEFARSRARRLADS